MSKKRLGPTKLTVVPGQPRILQVQDLELAIFYTIPKNPSKAKERIWISVNPMKGAAKKWLHTASICSKRVIHIHFEEDK